MGKKKKKESKNQVNATKSNIYAGKNSPSGDPVHPIDNDSAEGTLLVRWAPGVLRFCDSRSSATTF